MALPRCGADLLILFACLLRRQSFQHTGILRRLGADAGQTDALRASELYQLNIGHWLRVAVDQHYLVAGWVRDCSRNIQRCGMKFCVTPLSGL